MEKYKNVCTQDMNSLTTSPKEVQILKNNYQTNYKKLYALFKCIWEVKVERTFPLKCNFENACSLCTYSEKTQLSYQILNGFFT